MSSKPPLGVNTRPPPHPRTLSTSSLSQRPPVPRTLSQTYLPPSPIRKEIIDLTGNTVSGSPEGSNGARAQGFQRAGSRLKLELHTDSITHADLTQSPGALDAKPFTPSRVMTRGGGDDSDLGDMSPRTSHNGSTVDNEPTRMPMPKRCKRFTLTCSSRSSTSKPPPVTAKQTRDTRPKPWSVEIPADAPRYPPPSKNKTNAQSRTTLASSSGRPSDKSTGGHVDFHPWSGNHPEDRFSDHVIRNGYYDKLPHGQPETSSAKLTLFPMLKHKAGLHVLSNIFTSMLGQRRNKGTVNSEPTFKLPPRVTVTDTRREAWLKDLANPLIPVKKLSRTIPHGIRGKVLLEQCMNKNIPIDRAVWLSRCVGAQEMRSFKRKGATGPLVIGGEAKWIRDWTVNIEQFIETRINAFGEPDWKPKVQYA